MLCIVTNYDYLGRVTTESATQSGSTETITRTYGTSGTGQMRLISESLGSWTKNYEYGPYGRVISETMTNGTDFYYYFAQYGPDLQKVYSTMDKTYHDCYVTDQLTITIKEVSYYG